MFAAGGTPRQLPPFCAPAPQARWRRCACCWRRAWARGTGWWWFRSPPQRWTWCRCAGGWVNESEGRAASRPRCRLAARVAALLPAGARRIDGQACSAPPTEHAAAAAAAPPAAAPVRRRGLAHLPHRRRHRRVQAPGRGARLQPPQRRPGGAPRGRWLRRCCGGAARVSGLGRALGCRGACGERSALAARCCRPAQPPTALPPSPQPPPPTGLPAVHHRGWRGPEPDGRQPPGAAGQARFVGAAERCRAGSGPARRLASAPAVMPHPAPHSWHPPAPCPPPGQPLEPGDGPAGHGARVARRPAQALRRVPPADHGCAAPTHPLSAPHLQAAPNQPQHPLPPPQAPWTRRCSSAR